MPILENKWMNIKGLKRLRFWMCGVSNNQLEIQLSLGKGIYLCGST